MDDALASLRAAIDSSFAWICVIEPTNAAVLHGQSSGGGNGHAPAFWKLAVTSPDAWSSFAKQLVAMSTAGDPESPGARLPTIGWPDRNGGRSDQRFALLFTRVRDALAVVGVRVAGEQGFEHPATLAALQDSWRASVQFKVAFALAREVRLADACWHGIAVRQTSARALLDEKGQILRATPFFWEAVSNSPSLGIVDNRLVNRNAPDTRRPAPALFNTAELKARRAIVNQIQFADPDH